MTDLVHSSAVPASTTLRFRLSRATARLRKSIEQWIIAAGTRRALNAMPDHLLRDIGLTRADIPFVADALARGHGDATLDASGRVNRSGGAKPRRP